MSDLRFPESNKDWAIRHGHLKYCSSHGSWSPMVTRTIRCPKCLEEEMIEQRRTEEERARKARETEERLARLQKMFESPGLSEEEAKTRLPNPFLFTAKMFLSEVRSWRRTYRSPDYVCVQFAREIVDAATQRRLRCGYVTLRFPNNTGHAVVAFHTDYGLVYFEPQNGEQEAIQIGRPYGCRMDGVPDDCVVENITIEWNDGTEDRFSV